jgi:hypothetical protein
VRSIIVASMIIVGSVAGWMAAWALNGWPFSMRVQGQLRCEGAGAVIVNVDGTDYAVNSLAGPHYPPIQRVWNSVTEPGADIDRIIVQGLTLCDW